MSQDGSYSISGKLVVAEWSKRTKSVRFPPHIYDAFSYTFDIESDFEQDELSLLSSISEYRGDSHEIKIEIRIENTKGKENDKVYTVIGSFNQIQRRIKLVIPIKISEISCENGWILNDDFTINYTVTHGCTANKVDQNEFKEEWRSLIDLEGSFRSPTFHFNDLSFHVERKLDERTIDFVVVVDNLLSPISINTKITIVSLDDSRSVVKERRCDFQSIGDIAKFYTGFDSSNLQEYLQEGRLVIRIDITKITLSLTNGAPPPPPPPPCGIKPPAIPNQIKQQEEVIENLPFAGLKNQGATCYLNSLLQSLFHIPAFRSLVFAIPTSPTDDINTSIPLALQILFARMQMDNKPCSTRGLTISFGWDEIYSFLQQDIQELSRVLMDNLSRKIIGTPIEGRIDELFRGETRSYIECLNVPYKTERFESFYDLQLQVRGCSKLEDSLRLHNSKELLEGANQYTAEGFGKQDAYIGQCFTKLPQILQIHLSRFEYDYDVGCMAKVNDRLEFPLEMDLSEFVQSGKDNKEKYVYELFGVLVHAGSINGGHYYTFLRPSKEQEWFQFNDSLVKRASKSAATNDNFGGGRIDKGFSAYMLVYINTSKIPELYNEIPNSSIPEHVRNYIQENPDDEKCISKRKTPPKPISFTVTIEQGLKANARKSLISFSHQDYSKEIVMMSDKSISELYQKIGEEFNIKNFILWQCVTTGSPTVIFEKSDELLENVKQFSLFAQQSQSNGEITMYAFYYLPNQKQPLQYISSLASKKIDTIGALCDKANDIIGFPRQTSLIVYEATEPLLMRKLINEDTLEISGLANGNIIIFNVNPDCEIPTPTFKLDESAEEIPEDEQDQEIIQWNDFTGKKSLSTIDQFYENKITQICITIFSYDTLEKVCKIKIPRSCSQQQLKELIAYATKINITANDTMQLFKRDTKNNTPANAPISYSSNSVDLIFPQSAKKDPCLFFVVFYGITEINLRSMNSYIVEYSDDTIHMRRKTRIAIAKPSTTKVLCQQLRNMGITNESDDHLRLSLIKNCKFAKVYAHDEVLPDFLSIIRADVITEDDLHPKDDEQILKFILCESDPMNIAKPAYQYFMTRVNNSTKVRNLIVLAKDAFGVKEEEEMNLMFGQELAKVAKSSFFEEESTIKSILEKGRRQDPLIFAIRKPSGKVGVMACSEANQPIRIFN